jgi:hypothetical protein
MSNTMAARSRTSYSILCDNDSLYYFDVVISDIFYRLVAAPQELTDERQRVYQVRFRDQFPPKTGHGCREHHRRDADDHKPRESTGHGIPLLDLCLASVRGTDLGLGSASLLGLIVSFQRGAHTI